MHTQTQTYSHTYAKTGLTKKTNNALLCVFYKYKIQMKKDKVKMDETKTGLTKIKNYFRQHMAIIVVALLPNPRFDGQVCV
jgi:hypothetical protein